MQLTDLRCEHSFSPLAVEALHPRLSWRLDGRGGAPPVAWRVRVASRPDWLRDERADLWDSGRMEGEPPPMVHYAGIPLRSRQACWWTAQTWHADGGEAVADTPANWEMGLLHATDWQAKWIAAQPPFDEPAKTPPCPLFRTTFSLPAAVSRARCYVCGLGFHELYLNGEKIGDQVLAPAFTAYDRRALYLVHDVAGQLRPGDNVIGVILGNGWYNCQANDAWNFSQAPWRGTPRLRLQLEIDDLDGGRHLVVSGPHWRTKPGPVVFSDLRQGETFDARREEKGWLTSAFDASDWAPAHIVPPPGGRLVAQRCPPIRQTGEIQPVSQWPAADGGTVYDLGRAISGWAQLRVAANAGTEIDIRCAEKITAVGEIDPSDLCGLTFSERFQNDRYIARGKPVEIWAPRFVYHGFRYLHVKGIPGSPSREHVRGVVAHTDLPRRGAFRCSNELLNAIHECVVRSTLYNYHGMPTDCPHREKNGWTGDAHLSAEQALLNFDMAAAYEKWLDDLADAQRPSGQLPGIAPTGGWGFNFGSGPAWDSAYPLVAWYLYLYLGDITPLENHFERLARYVDYLHGIANDYLVEGGLGDWCPPEGGPENHECPAALTSTAYFFVSARIVAEAARLLGRETEHATYGTLAQQVKNAFLKRFFERDGGRAESTSQTAQACVLYQGLLADDPQAKARAMERLVEAVEARQGHLWTGILGAKYVIQALTENGRCDLAYAMATKTTFPSWGHWIRQGATTLWERWSGEGSRLHHMFSDVGAWFYKGLAGINPSLDKPGFRHVLIRPAIVGDLQWVEASHQSPYGPVAVRWQRDPGKIDYQISIPNPATATLAVEVATADRLRLDGRPIDASPSADGRQTIELTAGDWTLEVSRP